MSFHTPKQPAPKPPRASQGPGPSEPFRPPGLPQKAFLPHLLSSLKACQFRPPSSPSRLPSLPNLPRPLKSQQTSLPALGYRNAQHQKKGVVSQDGPNCHGLQTPFQTLSSRLPRIPEPPKPSKVSQISYQTSLPALGSRNV